MANFTDQFDKRDPFAFEAAAILDLLPTQIAWDARSLLEGKTKIDMKTMAAHVESAIVQQVDHLRQSPDLEHYAELASGPMGIGLDLWNGPFKTTLRKRSGDVNLFVVATDPLHPAGLSIALPFQQWEGLATLALWKLFDFYEVLSDGIDAFNDPQKWGGAPLSPRLTIWGALEGSSLLAEAMLACTLAAEGRMKIQHLAAATNDTQRKVSEALYQSEAKRRSEVSERTRAAVMVRHTKLYAHQLEALRHANSKPFKSRAAAARYVADMVEKGPNTYYTVAVVDGWLKAAGWRSVGVSTE